MKSRTLSMEINLDFHPQEWYVLPTIYIMPPLRNRVWMVAFHWLCFTVTAGSPI